MRGDMARRTYNGHFATELVLDLALLDGIWGLVLDDGEELFDTHVGKGSLSSPFARILLLDDHLFSEVVGSGRG